MAQVFFLSAVVTASVVMTLLALALWAWMYLSRRQTHYTRRQSFLYLINAFFTRVLWRTTTHGRIELPETQGAVIVSNHISGIDPLLIQLCVDRVVHWMVAREYYHAPGISLVFKALESIPVNRGGVDTASTKMAIRLAQQGGLVGLFPEGRVNMTKDPLLLPGRPGAALIALRARVPVIPCYVEGAPYNGTALGSFFMAAKAKVTIGKPIDLSEYYGRDHDRGVQQELTKRFLIEIAKLAGVDDFEPQLAGRNWKPSEDNANGDSHLASPTAGVEHQHQAE